MGMPPLNRSAIQNAQSGQGVVASGNNAFWPGGIGGGTVNDVGPQTFLARLTGARVGASYGWEKVYCSADTAGKIGVGLWQGQEANGGTPTNLPAIEPNGATDIAPGAIVFITPVEQGGTYQYIMIAGGAPRGGFPYGYSYGTVVLDAIAVPIYRYRCYGNDLQESVEWWLISAPGISATVSATNPLTDGSGATYFWCVGGECVEATVEPPDANSGPYTSLAQCSQNCI